jgi:hypothetical protein
MPKVVVAGAVMQCSHKGTLHLTGGDSRLSVSGAGAITFGMEAKLSFAPGSSPNLIAPCPGPPGSMPPNICTATLPATAGVSELVTIAGVGVLLDNATGNATNPSDPSATWSITSAGQTLLSADK